MEALRTLRALILAGSVACLVLAAPTGAQDLPPNRRPPNQGPKVPDRGATLDTSKLVYVRVESDHYFLRSMNADGSGDAEFWGERIECSSFALSPDGRTLYYSTRDGTYSKTQGSAARKLFDGQAKDIDVSPDASRLVYSRTVVGSGTDIYSANADGTGERRLTDAPRDDLTPCWSADGRTILYSEGANNWLMTMAADGSGKRALSEDVGPTRVRFSQARYSPDGTRIVAKGIQGGSVQIHVMNADGTSPRAITSGAGLYASPRWSPDARRGVAAYQGPGVPAEPWHLIVIPVDGGAVVRLPGTAPFQETQPRWLASSVTVRR